MLLFLALLIVLVNLISFFMNPVRRYDKLYCGLTAFSGENPFNRDKLALLFAYNESRGEDSCGLYNGKKVYKALGKVTTSILPFFNNITNPSTLFIGHTRAKTVGAVELETAHPFRAERYILAHNGTLEDYTSLANQYGISYSSYKVDSQVILHAIHKTNSFEVLTKFKGAGAFIIADTHKQNQLFIYRNDKRPLFYGTVKTENGNNIYISSMFNSLLAIGVLSNDIKSFTPEHLYTLEAGKIVSCVSMVNINSVKKITTKLFNFRKCASINKQVKEIEDLYKAATEYKALLEEYNTLLNTTEEVVEEVKPTLKEETKIINLLNPPKQEVSIGNTHFPELFDKVQEISYEELHKLSNTVDLFGNREVLKNAENPVNLRNSKESEEVEPSLIDSATTLITNVEEELEGDYDQFNDDIIELAKDILSIKDKKNYTEILQKLDADKLQQIITFYYVFNVHKLDTTNFGEVLKLLKLVVIELDHIQRELVGYNMEMKDTKQKAILISSLDVGGLLDSVEEALELIKKYSVIELSDYVF